MRQKGQGLKHTLGLMCARAWIEWTESNYFLVPIVICLGLHKLCLWVYIIFFHVKSLKVYCAVVQLKAVEKKQ